MRLLLDSCVWGGARQALEKHGHDIIAASDWDHDPGDDEILARAYREDRILITLDKDFGELAIVRGRPHCGIVRLVDVSGPRQSALCLHVLGRHGEELSRGAIVTADSNRLRIRPPDHRS